METIAWLADSTPNLNLFKSFVLNDRDFFIENNANVLKGSDTSHYFHFWNRTTTGFSFYSLFIIHFLNTLALGLYAAAGVFCVRKGDKTKSSTILILDTIRNYRHIEPRDLNQTPLFNFSHSPGIFQFWFVAKWI